jgi:hypothetical protein
LILVPFLAKVLDVDIVAMVWKRFVPPKLILKFGPQCNLVEKW